MINPAMMTFKEYCALVNEEGKVHPSSAFQAHIEDLNSTGSKADFPRLIRHLRRNGLQFEIREQENDRWAAKYVRSDDSGWAVRDENGEVVYLTPAEVEQRIPPSQRFQYEHAIIDTRSGSIVARTQDEWGCLLIRCAYEYQNMGLGTALLKAHWQRHPDRETGGMTARGQDCLYRTYQFRVSEALRNGEYRRQYSAGKMDMARIRAILDSANVVKALYDQKRAATDERYWHLMPAQGFRRHWRDTRDLALNNPKDLLVHAEDSFVLIYNRKLFDLVQSEDERDEYFAERGYIGYAHIGGCYEAGATPKLFRIFGQNDRVKAFLIECLLNVEVGEPIRVEADDLKLIRDHLGERLNVRKQPRSCFWSVWVDEPTEPNLSAMNYLEKQYRRRHDRFDEKWTIIHETASAMAEEAHRQTNLEESDLTMPDVIVAGPRTSSSHSSLD